jgi:colicin import membrane protein
MNAEKESARLERAIERKGLAHFSHGFSTSQAAALDKVANTFIQDQDDDVEEEEIIVEDIATPEHVKRSAELKAEADRIKREGEETARRAREEEHEARRQREAAEERRKQEEEVQRKRKEEEAKETEEQRLARVLAETTRRREQEQLSLQAKLREEKEQLQRQKEFADKALQVATQAATAPKKEPMRKVRPDGPANCERLIFFK